MAEQFLDFPQVPTWLRRIVAAEWRNPWAVISPTPRALQAARSRKLNPGLRTAPPHRVDTWWVRERGRRARQAGARARVVLASAGPRPAALPDVATPRAAGARGGGAAHGSVHRLTIVPAGGQCAPRRAIAQTAPRSDGVGMSTILLTGATGNVTRTGRGDRIRTSVFAAGPYFAPRFDEGTVQTVNGICYWAAELRRCDRQRRDARPGCAANPSCPTGYLRPHESPDCCSNSGGRCGGQA